MCKKKNTTKSVRNLLSYKIGTSFKGKEIKEWIKYNIDNETSRSKIARRMEGYLKTLDDNIDYALYKETYSSCAGYNDYFFRRVTA